MNLSLVVGKEIQQAKKFPMNAPRRGDNRGEESATRILCRVKMSAKREGWVLLKIPRGDIDGVGAVK